MIYMSQIIFGGLIMVLSAFPIVFNLSRSLDLIMIPMSIFGYWFATHDFSKESTLSTGKSEEKK